jgi:capsular polysaccharide transport system ATP-binding protein
MGEPLRTYSSGMRARLAFGLSLAIEFDCYLIDEIIGVGDQRFQRKSYEELFEKRRDRALLLASHHPVILKEYCSKALILHRGRGKVFDDIDLALDIYRDL